MKRIEGKVIVTWSDDPTPEDVLKVEMYVNDVISHIMKANVGAAIRVHLDGDFPPEPDLIGETYGDISEADFDKEYTNRSHEVDNAS